MTQLPVREMVLYKHGVGFFVREGRSDAETITLTFRRDEIDDVLKSLTVFDRAGGQVLGIHYQTPMDKATRLRNSSINLSNQASLHDLLRDLRGRQVTLEFESTSGTIETVTGRVIGIDQDAADKAVKVYTAPHEASTSVSVFIDNGQVRVFRFDALRTLTIHDSLSEHDLSHFLDTSMSEDTRRVVNVRLSEGAHDLYIAYVAPSPTWRVSYRIVAESDESGETGSALLQGWGLFDNRLEEDLEDVQVTLVAGQPISFQYDLYSSRIPQRPVVQDEARVAPGPVEFAGSALGDVSAEADIPDWLEGLEAAPSRGGAAKKLRRRSARREDVAKEDVSRLIDRLGPVSPEQVAESTMTAMETKEVGEFFQYVVTTPVSVKRGESALVPIINADVNYNRELLYNREKLPHHPVVALRFDNTTGLTLERGPVTVVEDGDYKGEAVVPFTKDGNEVYLAYAVELGVRVTEKFEVSTEITGLNIENAFLVFEEYYVHGVTYVLENTTPKSLKVTIEEGVNANFELFDTSPPDVETANERRWKVDVPARGKAEFTRKHRRLRQRTEEVRSLDYQNLSKFLENRWLEQSTFDQLSDMLDNLGLIDRARDRQEELIAERNAIYEQQEQLRRNMGSLQRTGQEAALRDRILGQLENSQDRLEAIEREYDDLSRQIIEAEANVEQIIAGLG